MGGTMAYLRKMGSAYMKALYNKIGFFFELPKTAYSAMKINYSQLRDLMVRHGMTVSGFMQIMRLALRGQRPAANYPAIGNEIMSVQPGMAGMMSAQPGMPGMAAMASQPIARAMMAGPSVY